MPPTHFVRVTVLDPVKPQEMSRSLASFRRRLRRQRCEYFMVTEWRDERRHHHLLVRADGDFDFGSRRPVVDAASCRGARVTSYFAGESAERGGVVTRYVVKDVEERVEEGGSAFVVPRQAVHLQQRISCKADEDAHACGRGGVASKGENEVERSPAWRSSLVIG